MSLPMTDCGEIEWCNERMSHSPQSEKRKKRTTTKKLRKTLKTPLGLWLWARMAIYFFDMHERPRTDWSCTCHWDDQDHPGWLWWGIYEGQKQRWRYCLGWKAFTNKKKSRSNGRSTTQLLTLFQSLSTSSSSLSSSRSFFLSSSATLAEHLSTTQPAIMKSQFLKKQKAEQLFSFRCWWETECERIDCTNTHTYLLRIYLTTVLLLNYYHYHYLLLLQLEDNNLSGKKLKKKKKGGK